MKYGTLKRPKMLGFPSPSFPVTEAMTTYFKYSMWSSLMIERIYSLLYQFEHRRSIFIDVFQKHNVHLSSETQSTIIYYTRTSRSTLIIRYLYILVMDSRATSGIRLRCANRNPYRRTLLVPVCTYVLVLTVFWYNTYLRKVLYEPGTDVDVSPRFVPPRWFYLRPRFRESVTFPRLQLFSATIVDCCLLS